MNSTTSNAMPDTAPEVPIELRPAPQDTDTSDRVREMHPGAELGWSNHGGMVEQQASANKWVEAASEERAGLLEMTDSRQAAQAVQYSRWTGEPLGESAGQTQSAGIGQSH